MNKKIQIDKVMASALIGTTVNDCIKEAMSIAIKEWRNVELQHNGNKYTINVNDLLYTVIQKDK